MDAPAPFIRSFETLGLTDLPIVGGKNASLGELIRELGPLGVRVPAGFAVTVEGWRSLMAQEDLGMRIFKRLEALDPLDPSSLHSGGQEVREMILAQPLSAGLAESIVAAYRQMDPGTYRTVAVRSSATAEDLPEASFAGQQESFLDVMGPVALLDACCRCYASLYTDRAIAYRAHRLVEVAEPAISS